VSIPLCDQWTKEGTLNRSSWLQRSSCLKRAFSWLKYVLQLTKDDCNWLDRVPEIVLIDYRGAHVWRQFNWLQYAHQPLKNGLLLTKEGTWNRSSWLKRWSRLVACSGVKCMSNMKENEIGYQRSEMYIIHTVESTYEVDLNKVFRLTQESR